MATSFDPYLNWLGIPQSQRPITYYGLLGVKPFEKDAAVIAAAAQKRVEQLRRAVRATNSPDYQHILKEITTASDCLLNPALKERYDQKLRQQVSKPVATERPVSPPPPPRTVARPAATPRSEEVAAFVAPLAPTAANVPPTQPVAENTIENVAHLAEPVVAAGTAKSGKVFPRARLALLIAAAAVVALGFAGRWFILQQFENTDVVAGGDAGIHQQSGNSDAINQGAAGAAFAGTNGSAKSLPQDAAGGSIPSQRSTEPPLELVVSGGARGSNKSVLIPLLQLGPLPGDSQASRMELSGQGNMLAVCLGKEILLWTFRSTSATGGATASTVTVSQLKALLGHRSRADQESSVNAVRFTPDEKRLVSAGDDGTVRIWNTESGSQLYELSGHDGPVRDVAVMPDGERVLAADAGHEMKLWNLATGARAGRHVLWNGATQICVMSPGGDRLAMLQEAKVAVSQVENKRIHSTRWLTADEDADNDLIIDELPKVSCVCFSPDGKLLVTGGEAGGMTFWNMEQQSIIRSLAGHENERVVCLAFVGGGDVLASAGSEAIPGSATLWDAATGKRLASLPGHSGRIQLLAASGNGRRLATLGARDRLITIWEYRRLEE